MKYVDRINRLFTFTFDYIKRFSLYVLHLPWTLNLWPLVVVLRDIVFLKLEPKKGVIEGILILIEVVDYCYRAFIIIKNVRSRSDHIKRI